MIQGTGAEDTGKSCDVLNALNVDSDRQVPFQVTKRSSCVEDVTSLEAIHEQRRQL